MKYLLFTNTPAQVHVFKHVAAALENRGHDVLILARKYGCTIDLLDWFDLPYQIYGACDTTTSSLLLNLPGHYYRMIRAARQFNPDVIFGHGAYSAHTGLVTGARTVLVTDSEPETLDMTISRPFVDAILTPNTYRKNLGAKHYVFNGFTENAYLHPEVFSPRDDIRSYLGVDTDPYVLVRFNAFGSHHDVGQAGLSPDQRRTLIEELAKYAVVFVSDEGKNLEFDNLPARPFDLHPALLHDVLAEAELLVADTQTMVTEAALLGTPAIRSNSFVGKDDMGNFIELEEADLIYNLADFDEVLERAVALVETDGVKRIWRDRRTEFMKDKVNLNELLVDVATLDRSLNRIANLETRSERIGFSI